MKKNLSIILYLSIIIGLISCNLTKQNIFNNNKLPGVLEYIPPLRSKDAKSIFDLIQKERIIVHYFNGNCSACIAKLFELEKFVDLSGNTQTGLLFIAQTNDTMLLSYHLDRLNFKPGVLFDKGGIFYRWNKNMIDKGVSTFLVSQEGKIIFKGNPIENQDIELKYNYWINKDVK